MGVSVDGGLNDNISTSMPLLLMNSFELTDGELHIHTVCVVAECRCDGEKSPEAKCKID